MELSLSAGCVRYHHEREGGVLENHRDVLNCSCHPLKASAMVITSLEDVRICHNPSLTPKMFIPPPVFSSKILAVVLQEHL